YEGITVAALASTGAEAYQACRELRPDVVLVDIDLGEESGFEVARQLTDQADTGQPLVILISAHAADDVTDLIADSADNPDSPAILFLPKVRLSAAAIRGTLAGAAGGPAWQQPLARIHVGEHC